MGFPGKNTGVGCHFLLQEIFQTQGLNPGLPHCRQILYHLSHQVLLCFCCTDGGVEAQRRKEMFLVWTASEQESQVLNSSQFEPIAQILTSRYPDSLGREDLK